MLRGGLTISILGMGRPRSAARFQNLTIRRVITIHPIDTTMRSTQATVRSGSRKSSSRARALAPKTCTEQG